MITPEMTLAAVIKAETVVNLCRHAPETAACMACIEKAILETMEDYR